MNTRPNIRTRALGVLASILSAGALAPTSPPPAATASAASGPQVTAPAGQAARAPAATPAPAGQVGQALANLMGSGGAGFRDPGFPPHLWGQSAACKQMRLKNVRRGLVPHYCPRARA